MKSFFRKKLYNTISKSDLLKILKNNSTNFGKVHNMYHIVEKLKNKNITFYEEIYDEHLLAYSKDIPQTQNELKVGTLEKALRYISLRLKADINAKKVVSMSYEYLVKIIGVKKLKEEIWSGI